MSIELTTALGCGYYLSLGLPTGVLRFIPQYKTKNDWERLGGIVRRSWQLTFSAGLILAIFCTRIILFFKIYISLNYLFPMLLGVWMIPILSVGKLQSEMFRAIQHVFLAYAPPLIIQPLLILGIAFLLFQVNHKLTSTDVLIAAVSASFIILIAQLFLLKQFLPFEINRHTPIYETREWLNVCIPLLLVDGLWLILHQTDTLMIGAIMGPEKVGIYEAATKTASWVSFALLAVNTVTVPMFASLYSQEKYKDLQKLVHTAAHWTFWPSLAITLFVILFSEPILRLFGSDFVAVRWETDILAFGQLVNAGAGSVGYLLNMTGYQNQSARVYAWSALVNVVLNAVGIPLFGITGAAIATAITMALWNIWLHNLVVKNLNIYPSVISAIASNRLSI